MNIDKWIVAHFSPTGGTKKIADAIAQLFIGRRNVGILDDVGEWESLSHLHLTNAVA